MARAAPAPSGCGAVMLWASAVLAQSATEPARRDEIRARLRSSPFLLDRAVREWLDLWGSVRG